MNYKLQGKNKKIDLEILNQQAKNRKNHIFLGNFEATKCIYVLQNYKKSLKNMAIIVLQIFLHLKVSLE